MRGVDSAREAEPGESAYGTNSGIAAGRAPSGATKAGRPEKALAKAIILAARNSRA